MAAESEPLLTLFRTLLERMGENPDRAGLERTPQRAIESYLELTRGLREDPATLAADGVFEDPSKDLVLVKRIAFTSLCEHHLLPFIGFADVGYLPNGRVLGLSKVARIVDHFACRLQVQERMTAQIADFIRDLVRPRALGIRVTAQHLCMTARGVRKQDSEVVTQAWRKSADIPTDDWSTFLQSMRG